MACGISVECSGSIIRESTIQLSIFVFLEEDSTEGTKEETASEGTEFTYSEDFEVTQFIIHSIKLSKPKMP